MRYNHPILFTAFLLSGSVKGFGDPSTLSRQLPSRNTWRLPSSHFAASSEESSSTSLGGSEAAKFGTASDAFLADFFRSECDDYNVPPSLSILMRGFSQLASGSDIRGRFVDHPRVGSNMASIAQAVSRSPLPALTPFAAHCLGFAFATMLKGLYPADEEVVICIGRDPRAHGPILADAFARGAEGVQGCRVVYTGIATTPAMSEFCRESLCDGGVMVTKSHLPEDRNGFKFFTTTDGFSKRQIQTLIGLAKEHAQRWYDMSVIPPTSGTNAVYCSEWVNWMPHYELQLKHTLMKQVHGNHDEHTLKHTLKGLRIVLNAGNGSGGFFKQVLEDLGADVSGSLHDTPNSLFPNGIPNPESQDMVDETIEACEKANADIGILLDTDADRCGMVLPRKIGPGDERSDFEPLNRNRLIAMMGVIFASQSPGCAIVTDSVTSNGLAKFLEEDLGLKHVRYLRGYSNVIGKAKMLSQSGEMNAEVAIETSGHCALKENAFLDDGTATAVKVIGQLAQHRQQKPDESLLDLIRSLGEMEEVVELRTPIRDGTMETTAAVFDLLALQLEGAASDDKNWTLDRENLEGIRISTSDDGGFFMVRKSLHDPVLSFHVEASSRQSLKDVVAEPVMDIIRKEDRITAALDLSSFDELLGHDP